ncbi:MAG: hypothetical protein ISS45_01405 [Candidatus Omnitrophica bacterium]|nr:hypothetical protein [Candidatus Omnitrophota bacterium]
MVNKGVDLDKLPLGLIIMKYIYAGVALGCAFSAVFASPYTKVAYCSIELGSLPSILINSVLILFPLLLYFGFSRPTITIWYLAFLYHLFFIGNSFLSVLSTLFPKSTITPLLEISGKSTYVFASTTDPLPILAMRLFSVFNITMLVGIFILWYLWQKREYFMPKTLLKDI